MPKDVDSDILCFLRKSENGLLEIGYTVRKVASSQPLVSEKISFEVFGSEYSDEDLIYIHKLEDLKKRYTCVRRTRGDGNCFYRAFGFSYFERLLQDKKELQRFTDVAKSTRDDLIKLGFPEFTIDDFHENFMEVVGKLESEFTLTELTDTFNDQGLSDYLIVYLRLIVSGFLQKEAEFYTNFIEGDRSIKEFCNQEVEPMGKESDHIHIIALTNALGVPVRVEYMDRGEGDQCNHHDFPDGSKPGVILLYRPGHYDILYT
ncbi:hypothetical protein FSP39_017552 [Pinctada imbricata]|uniref:ubiquitinyl hydrolase 1 n=1 Tax=Pinctada imbricata TaxID=66713 RepID=A0AA88XX76_PINIB|nr:hypothetical protein FSP39_017552 [Pinctada imbricata]